MLLLPIIAGVSYEVLRLGARFSFMKVFIYPGLLLQGLSTIEPTDDMIEVAIKAMKAVKA